MTTLQIGGHEIILKEFITGRDQRTIFEKMPQGVTIGADGGVAGLNALQLGEMQDASLRAVIVSFDGKSDGVDGFSIVDAVLDLQADVTNEIVKTVSAVINPEKKR